MLMRKRMAAVCLVWIPGFAALADEYVHFDGAVCSDPPALHCPAENCSADRVINQGPVVEMETRRTFFLDYPCDLRRGEPVTVVLSLHGGGSYGNWQRHYFPLLDYVTAYRLVVATPNSPTQVWSEADDGYLRNVTDYVIDGVGADNVRAFWLVGHSQGGMTSNRILRSDYFSRRVDGWLSLSGGRLGGNPGRAPSFGPPSSDPAEAAQMRERMARMQGAFAQAAALLDELPERDISFLYTTGEREVDAQGVPAVSAVAAQLHCGPRRAGEPVVDTRAGYVYDGSRQNAPNPAWGLLPAPGRAEVYEYPQCRDGRVVSDVVRLGKGHTEGFEPAVTERLVALMVSAPGGRVQALAP